MTKIIPIRLNEAELLMLSDILSSPNCESDNRSEWFRLLLHREHNKRKRLGVPASKDFQTAYRVGGRPSWWAKQEKIRLAGKSRNTRNSRQKPVIHFLPARTSPALSISRSTTRASSGAMQRTKTSRVTRRGQVQTLRAK
jgi:hypothetical protein